MSIDYESMKDLIKMLDKYGIHYSFGNYYSNIDEKIIGHWIKIDVYLNTDEIDEADREYNEN